VTTSPNDHDSAPSHPIDRRSAIKKAVAGAAITGVAWSAPRVEGLSLRPNYAAAASATVFTGTVDLPDSTSCGQSSVNTGLPAGVNKISARMCTSSYNNSAILYVSGPQRGTCNLSWTFTGTSPGPNQTTDDTDLYNGITTFRYKGITRPVSGTWNVTCA
jgi:hypothetical protein